MKGKILISSPSLLSDMIFYKSIILIVDETDEEDYFFEFRIQMDEITKDVSLIVTDFSDEEEIEEAKLLWDSLISDLKQVLGSS